MELELLGKTHIKKDFNCGNEQLDGYLKNQARQDYSRDLSVCYVLSEEKVIVGYYTLSSNTIDRGEFPEELIKKLPSTYINLPTVLLGRLAVDSKYQGKGYGKFLLINALNEALELSKRVGILAMVVEPIDNAAEKFYAEYGFILLPGTGKMFITIKTLRTSI